ncbi:MAG: OmpA family protein [Burkholderiales bacterium]|nr:OmpA family protein [Burkholderiales bacterium]
MTTRVNHGWRHGLRALALLTLLPLSGLAQTPPTVPAAAANRLPVVVSGSVPDEAARQAILGRAREVFGADRVIDQLGVGSNLAAPPNWSAQVQKALQPVLNQVSHGHIAINGNVVEVNGEVANDATRQQLPQQLSIALGNPTYTVRNGLRVAAAGQELVDAALANRIVEFERGSAILTPKGVTVLDELAPVLMKLSGRKFEVVGHTDANGAHAANVALSSARAEAVKAYLVRKGIASLAISTAGLGPDRPVADNNTEEGRARNRRIEFRVGK